MADNIFSKRGLYFFFFVIVLGIALRGMALDDAYLSPNEASLVLGAKGDVSSDPSIGIIENTWSWTEGRLSESPFFSLIFRVWISLFGVNEYLLKMFPMIFGLLSLLMIYKLGKLLFDEKVGVGAMALLSVLPIAIIYSVKLISFTFNLFLMLSVLYFFLKYNKDRVMKDMVFFVLFSILLVLVFPYSSIVFLALFLLSLVFNRAKKGIDNLLNADLKEMTGDFKMSMLVFFFFIIGLVAFFKLFIFENGVHYFEGMFFGDTMLSLSYAYKAMFGNFLVFSIVLFLSVLLFVLAFIQNRDLFKENRLKYIFALLLSLSFIAPILLFLIQLGLEFQEIAFFVFLVEHALVLIVPFLLLVSYGLFRLIKNTKFSLILSVLMYVLLLVGLMFPAFTDDIVFEDRDGDLIESDFDSNTAIIASKYSRLAFNVGYYYANECFSNDISYHLTAEYLDCLRDHNIYTFQVNRTDSGNREILHYGYEGIVFSEIMDMKNVVLMSNKLFAQEKAILGTATARRAVSGTFYHNCYDEYYFN